MVKKGGAICLKIMLALLVLCSGCAKSKAGEPPPEPVFVGTLVEIASPLDEDSCYRVRTTEGFYFTYEAISGKVGAKVSIDPKGMMTIEGTPFKERVAGFAPW